MLHVSVCGTGSVWNRSQWQWTALSLVGTAKTTLNWSVYCWQRRGKLLQLHLLHAMWSRARVIRSHDLLTLATREAQWRSLCLSSRTYPSAYVKRCNACVINLPVFPSSHAIDIYAGSSVLSRKVSPALILCSHWLWSISSSLDCKLKRDRVQCSLPFDPPARIIPHWSLLYAVCTLNRHAQ